MASAVLKFTERQKAFRIHTIQKAFLVQKTEGVALESDNSILNVSHRLV